MFRTRLHPTSVGLAGGIVLIALWVLLWSWFLIGLVRGAPEKQARQPGAIPELARVDDVGSSRGHDGRASAIVSPGRYRSTEPL